MNILKRLVLIPLCLPFWLFAHGFVYGDKDLLNPKTLGLIEDIGTELLTKTGVYIYVFLDNRQNTKAQRQEILKHFKLQAKSPYVLMAFFKRDKKIILESQEEIQIDVDGIYQDYMVPLLPIQKADVLDSNRISAIILNGYTHLASEIAEKKEVKLLNNIVDKNGELVARVARFAIKVMLFVMVVFLGWFFFIRRKR